MWPFNLKYKAHKFSKFEIFAAFQIFAAFLRTITTMYHNKPQSLEFWKRSLVQVQPWFNHVSVGKAEHDSEGLQSTAHIQDSMGAINIIGLM